jgi:hypothetical protein
MKKTLPLLLALMVSATATFAQDAAFQKFRMGFKASPNISWFQPKDKHFLAEGANLRFGYGFIADIFFSENYAFGTGLNIYRNGGSISYLELDKISAADYIYRRYQTYSNQYVEVPITFKLRTNEIGYVTYWAQFGFGAGVNIGARGDDERNYLFQQDLVEDQLVWVASERETVLEENADLAQNVALFRASMIIAAGIEYSLSGTTSILVGLTYNNGFTNSFARKDVLKTEKDGPIFNANNRPETVRLNAVANAIELNVGILF